MPASDFTAALARLLTDHRLRQRFHHDPRAAASELGLGPADAQAFAALDPSGVEEQAEALLSKRFHEVAQLLPQTVARLGDSACVRFLEYAENHAWPEGHRRHWLDSVAFGRYLRRMRAPELCRAEFNRVAFVANEQRFTLALVRENSALPKLQILYRRDGEPRQLALKFGP